MRAIAEINLDAIRHNVRQVKSKTESKIMGIIKANAYGHGVKQIASVLKEEGVYAFGVATADEAIEIRKYGFTEPILILGVTFPEEYHMLIDKDISLCVSSPEEAEMISKTAQSLGKEAKIHIKLDTGMGRIGFVCGDNDEKNAKKIEYISKLPNIFIEGIFSHMSKADEEDKSYANMQFERFMKMCTLLEGMGIKPPLRHIANSASIVSMKHTHLDMVRMGIITYGLKPSEAIDEKFISLRPAMTLKARVSHIKEIKNDSLISYGGHYKASKGQKIATICLGYADGFSRILSDRAYVLINGKKAKITGNICMDQCMADITHIEDAKVGDEVIIFGTDGNNTISVDTVALLLGTINYEVVCSVTGRVPRTYIQDS